MHILIYPAIILEHSCIMNHEEQDKRHHVAGPGYRTVRHKLFEEVGHYSKDRSEGASVLPQYEVWTKDSIIDHRVSMQDSCTL
jgi:hypothetical protein